MRSSIRQLRARESMLCDSIIEGEEIRDASDMKALVNKEWQMSLFD